MLVSVSGGAQRRALGVKLRAAGTGGKILRSNVRRNIVGAVKPMQAAVKANVAAIPAHETGDPALRAAISKATKIRVRTSGPSAVVRLWVDPAAMPAGMETLPAYMEGDRGRWLHPVYSSSRERWSRKVQSPHPYFKPAVQPRIVGVRAACLAAVKETAATI